jgi:hypothetical protein
MPDTSELEGVRSKLTDLYNTIGQAYADLNNAGRESEAAQLREAADRFAKIGSQYGANAFVRQAALQDLSNKFRIAGQVVESGNMTKKIGEQLSVLNSLANVTGNVFASAMERAKMVQTGDQQAAQNALQRMQINASLEAAARNRAAVSQNKLKQQAISGQAQNRGMPTVQGIDPWTRMQMSNFNAKLNAAGSTVPYSGAPAGGGMTNSSLPWYTGPIAGQQATPAAIAGGTPYAPPGSTGGTTGGAASPQIQIVNGQASPYGWTTGNEQKASVNGTPTSKTVAAKKAAANNLMPTAPIDTFGPQVKSLAAPLAEATAARIGGWPVKAALAGRDAYKLVQKVAGGAFDWAYGNK